MSESVELEQIDISADLLGNLTDDQRCMFAALSLANSEIEALRSGLRVGPNKPFEPVELSEIFLSRQFALMRMISMKQMEILITLGGKGSANESQDNCLRTFRKLHVRPRRKEIRSLAGSSLVQELRNRAGFHYDLSQFREADVDHNRTHKLLSNKSMEFSGGVLGDLYIASMLQTNGAESAVDNARRHLQNLSEYIVECGRVIQEIWTAFLEEFILPHSKLEKKEFDVPSFLVAERGVTPFALFVRQTNYA